MKIRFNTGFLMETYSEPSRVSKMEPVTKLVYEFKPLTVFFCKERNLRCSPGSEYTSGLTNNMCFYILTYPMKVCFQMPFGRGLCFKETSQLIDKGN